MSKFFKFPSQIKFIVGNEAAERFSYYGMRSILTVFMIQELGMLENNAKGIYHYFIALGYLTPLLGGYISDRFLGKYRTIIYLSILYCIGHGVLAFWAGRTGLYVGLFLIALGMGGIKPCVSAHVGDQFTSKNQILLQKVFEIFYFCINFGALFSQLLIPWIMPRYGAAWAFGIPGILMAVATWVFWLGRDQYVHVPPRGKTGEAGFLPIVWYALTHKKSTRSSSKDPSFLDAAATRYSQKEVEGAKSAWDIFKVFIGVVAFWALYDQQGSSWTLQALRMNLNVFGMKLEASQIQALNPLFILILIPIFSLFIFPWVEKILRKPVTPLMKMVGGMYLTGFSFISMAIFERVLDSGHVISVAWQILPYLILSAGEVLVSITGLEFAYTQAPRSLKSTIMGFWFCTIFAGNFFTGMIAQANPFKGIGEFLFFGALMFAFSVIFHFGARRYRVRNYMES